MWVALSLLAAFFRASQDVLGKHVLRGMNEYVMVVGSNVIGCIILFSYLLLSGPLTVPQPGFWKVAVVTALFDAAGNLLYFRAIRVSDISVSVPLINFTPLFLLVISPIMLGEFANSSGVLGVLLIVTGAWMLNARRWREGVLAPFQALLKEPGPRLILFVAFLWSITSNFHKIGITLSDPIYYACVLAGVRAVVLTPVMILHSRSNLLVLGSSLRVVFPLGILLALTFICQMHALELTLVAYVVSIKRMSAVFSIIMAYFIFKEGHIRDRLLGASVMCCGTAVISMLS